MNGEVCCILGICCPPASTQRRGALVKQLVTDLPTPITPEAVADWILANFDLAPKGTLQPFVDRVVAMARTKP